ncbi:MAG: hypothetical protein VYD19_06050, partial [Myxococcota bacterium]|nr:hypothetical protein [Myxococcota bacterium]
MKLIPLLLSLLFPVFPFFISSLHAQAPSWPADDGWLELRQGADSLMDIVGDAQGARDIVDDVNTSAYIQRDQHYFYFRLRLDDTPQLENGDYQPFGWGVMFDVNNNVN